MERIKMNFSEEDKNIYKPSYTWPNKAFPFRKYYDHKKCRIFIIENIVHNWNWLHQYSHNFRETDFFMVQLGWHYNDYTIQECNHIFEILKLRKSNFIFMYPDFATQSLFKIYGFEGDLINQNCFLDYDLFKIIDSEKIYDAVYTARLSAFKRHNLATKVENLALIAGNTDGPKIEDLPNHKYINKTHLSPNEVLERLSESKVGLILSEVEGACYASSEYLLSGLPVVSTYSKGGREIWYNDYNSVVCESSPESVANAVKKLISYKRDPLLIRNMHIELSNYFRTNFIRSHQRIIDTCGVSDDANSYFINNFQHRLRSSIVPDFENLFCK